MELCRLVLALIVTVLAAVVSAENTSSPAVREDALRRAKVWIAPPREIEAADLQQTNGPGGFGPHETVACRFKPEKIGGTTPKFDCQLSNGDTVRVKYGRRNAEVYAEVIASRLMNALGFPADYMYVVHEVRCFGCPGDPFPKLKCLSDGGSERSCLGGIDFQKFESFEDAIVERRREGAVIRTDTLQGWTYEELAKIDHAAGGASRAEVDALRLLAVFLAHWDNKASNQRLVCLDPNPDPQRPCATPLAMNQDLGGTFGPPKLDVNGWRSSPIWADAASCTVSMRHLPFKGATFVDARISEEGRRFLGDRLRRLSDAQIRGLFTGARIDRYPHKDPNARDANNWVRVFQEKVRAIADRPACPATP